MYFSTDYLSLRYALSKGLKWGFLNFFTYILGLTATVSKTPGKLMFLSTGRLGAFDPGEPPFSGDDGEPETATPSFIWGYLIDKHRYHLKETEKMEFADSYLTFLLQPYFDLYREKLQDAFAAEVLIDPFIAKANQKLLDRENPYDYPLVDGTDQVKQLQFTRLAPGALSMPNRTKQLTRFLASNPESRIQLRPRIRQLGGFLGGRTPYS